MAFLVCLLFRESIGVAITKSFVIFVRKFFVSSCMYGQVVPVQYCTREIFQQWVLWQQNSLNQSRRSWQDIEQFA